MTPARKAVTMLRVVRSVGRRWVLCAAAFCLLGEAAAVSLRDVGAEWEALGGADARMLGLGLSGGAALATSPASMTLNPALLAALDGVQAGVSDAAGLSDRAFRQGAISAAASLEAFGAGRVGNAGLYGSATGWDPSRPRHQIGTAAYASPREMGLSFGVGVRQRRHVMGGGSIVGWGLDAGVHSRHRLGSAVVDGGASVAGLGLRLGAGAAGLLPRHLAPPVVRVAVAVRPDAATLFAWQATYADDASRPAGERILWHVGGERWLWGGRTALRAGYRAFADAHGITRGRWALGASLRVASAQLDYAFLPPSRDTAPELRAPHRLSVTFEVGPSAPPGHVPTPGRSPEPAVVLPDAATRHVLVTEHAISPNGDGVRDVATFRLRNLPPAWRLDIVDRERRPVRRFAAGALMDSTHVTWDGRDDSGTTVRDGVYVWRLLATPDDFGRALAEGAIAVDTTAPELAVSVDPLLLLRRSDDEPARLRLRANDTGAVASWQVRVYGSGPETILTQNGTGPVPDMLLWRHWQPAAAEATHVRAEVVAADAAGNRTAASAAAPVLDLRAYSVRRVAGSVEVLLPTSPDSEAADATNLRRQLLAAMAAAPGLTVRAEARGRAVARLLSKERARALVDYLARQGVSRDRVTIGEPAAEVGGPAGVALLLRHIPEAAEPLSRGLARAAQPTPTPGAVALRAASFRDGARAARFADVLDGMSLGAAVRVEETSLSNGTWFRVMVGNFGDREAAEAARQTIVERLGVDAAVTAPVP
jgi:hypothetical protein